MARNEKFLPAGSKLVLQQKNRPATWYTTTKEIILAAVPVAASCPISGDPVVTTTAHGLPIWFLPRMVRSRIVLDKGDVDEKVFDEQISLFDYDVHGTAFPNPSNRLYPVAIRMTESIWMMRTSDIPYSLMSEMQDAGCTVDVTLLDKSETRRKVYRAVSELQAELSRRVESANKTYDDAVRNMEAGVDGKGRDVDVETAERNTLRAADALEKRLTLLAADITKAATRFGIREQAVNINRLGHTAKTIGDSMRERAQAYVAAQAALRSVGTDTSKAIANMANDNAADRVPVFAMADLLRDEGKDADADRLQAAFSDDDAPFSIADAGMDDAA